MSDVTSKVLHEQTADCLDRVGRGERLRVVRNGEAAALLVPAKEHPDPAWAEIMSEVRAARVTAKAKRANPVLTARSRRNYANHLR